MNIEQAINITSKLYGVRQCVQELHGNKWRSRLQPYMDELGRIHKASGISYLTLGQQLAKEMQARGISPLMILAAMIEILEPSGVKQ
jgi:hypothetical protein